MTVIIIDDDPSISRLMEAKLNKEGIEARAFQSSEEGLKELEKGGYALLLLDLLMPGMTGWDVLTAIREKNIPVKTIVISNLSTGEDRNKALDLGATEYVVKSDIDLSKLVEKVRGYLSN